MFGNSGKIQPKPKKAKKRHGMAFYVIGVFTFAIEMMLGINAAFLVDQSISIVARNMLDGTFLAQLSSIITLIVSLAVGFCFIWGGLWTFAGFMDSLDDARAYRDTYGTNNWPVVMVWLLLLAVVLLDFTTLMFRASYFAEKGAGPLFAFFVILIFMPPILGPLIHVLEHTPRDRRLAKVRHFAESIDTDEYERAVQTMDADLRSRLLEGDQSALQEHYNRVDAVREANAQYEQEAMQRRKAGQQEKNRPFSVASLAQQATERSPKERQ